MAGQLEGLARAVANERPYREAALDLRLQVRRPADRRLRVNEGRLLRTVQEQRRPAGGRGLRLIQCGVRSPNIAAGEGSVTEFRIRYCHGRAPSPRTSRERRADPGLG